MSQQGLCIYCLEVIPNLNTGDGDHVIPAAFGEFLGGFAFRRICPKCNTQISKSEEQVIRCAPEGFFRILAKPLFKRKKRGSGLKGSHGLPAPKFMVRHHDHREIANLNPANPEEMNFVNQLVVVKGDGAEHHVRLYAEMTEKGLKKKIARLKIAKGDRCYIHVDEALAPHIRSLFAQVLPNTTQIDLGTKEAGVHKAEFRMQFHRTDRYWQAVAKIAFHYYLVNSIRGLSGAEPEFDAIRKFILHGGDHEDFFVKGLARFALPFRELSGNRAIVPSQWTHVIAVDESCDDIIAAVSLFGGPRRVPGILHLRLGTLRSLVVIPNACYGHVYLHDKKEVAKPDSPSSKYAGRVEELTFTRLR